MPYLPEHIASNATDAGSSDSRSVSLEGSSPREPTPLEELLAQIDIQCPYMNVSQHPLFDTAKINPAAKMPLEYGPLVHALSALSVGGGSFANSMPSGSIDNAVSSFQQLLETLTQTISDLLRLLPRTTWDDSSSFDGVLRDMLKGDDFLDDGNEEGNSKEDEVAALTMALERRARWMEVQLSKLEELHRDINMAAVRAVLSFNDNGWDAHGFMPRVGNTLQRFDNLGFVNDGSAMRAMSADELEKKLVVAREAAVFAETEVKEMIEKLQILRPEDEEDEYY
jgi:CCR4-NOT transcription complex subunit 4